MKLTNRERFELISLLGTLPAGNAKEALRRERVHDFLIGEWEMGKSLPVSALEGDFEVDLSRDEEKILYDSIQLGLANGMILNQFKQISRVFRELKKEFDE